MYAGTCTQRVRKTRMQDTERTKTTREKPLATTTTTPTQRETDMKTVSTTAAEVGWRSPFWDPCTAPHRPAHTRTRPRPVLFTAEVGWRSLRGPMHDTPPTGPAPEHAEVLEGPPESEQRRTKTSPPRSLSNDERKRTYTHVSDQEPFLTQTQRCPCTGCVEKRGLPTRRQSQEQVQSTPRPPQTPWAAV